MKFSSKIEKCGLSPIRKFYPYQVACKAKGTKIYHLNIGQPDIKTPESYFETVRNFNAPVLEYAPSPGMPECIKKVEDYYKNIGMDINPGDVVITAGGSEAITFTMMCILDDGDEILIPEPFYPNYKTFIYNTGATIVPIPTTAEEGYHFAEREKIEKLITPKTRAIMFTNPGNPTGTVLTAEERQLMADIAKEHDLWIIADEVYREFTYNGEALATMGTYEEVKDNVIIIDSVSKRFSACGARIGAVICRNKQFQAEFMKLCQARLSVPTLDQLAAASLYDVDPSYFKEVNDEYKKRRDTVYAALKKIPGLVCSEPQGAFYMMVKMPVDDAEKLLIFLLEEFEDNGETVMFAPGGGFYQTEGKGINEMRIAYILNCQDLERAIELLGKGIAAYNAKYGK
ncbi:MAG: pyridoxal phosphate-dependent aminotransferase [Clostridia bacterium]|nr:pyridoxal phosphate-dependent aminotransferase [Clostridia bacterium]